MIKYLSDFTASTMVFKRCNSAKKYEEPSAKESLVRMLVINLIGEYIALEAQIGKPILHKTMLKDTVRKNVLFPAILAPVTIKNCSFSIVKSLSIRPFVFNKGCPNFSAFSTTFSLGLMEAV